MKLITLKMLDDESIRQNMIEMISRRIFELRFESDNNMSMDQHARASRVEFQTVPQMKAPKEIDHETVEVEGTIKADIELQTQIHTTNGPEEISDLGSYLWHFRIHITVKTALRKEDQKKYFASFKFELKDLAVL